MLFKKKHLKFQQTITLMNADRSTQPNDSSFDSWNLLRKWMTESLDESYKLHKGLIFWVCNFHEFIFLGLIFAGIYFCGYPKICLGRAPLSLTCQSTLPGDLTLWSNIKVCLVKFLRLGMQLSVKSLPYRQLTLSTSWGLPDLFIVAETTDRCITVSSKL